MKKVLNVFLAIPILLSLSCKSLQTSLIAKDAKVQLVSSGYSFTEGPAVAPNGDVFFTDQPNDRILKWTAKDNTVSVYMAPSGRSNGLYFDHDGNLLACADEKNELWSIDPNKNVTVLIEDFQGKKLNGPNDLWADPKGGIYFTDPFYKRPYWSRTEQELEKQNVYYLTPDQKDIITVANDYVRPNGIIGNKEGNLLYVADIGDKKTYSYTINPDASLGNKILFTNMGSDGMTMDNQGNVYLTGNGVTVFNPKGEQILHIPIDQKWTANVTFGGKDQKTLIITAMNSLYSLKMNVKGIR
ncbi:SMP-30/gluconolactonase/LRE family protein [Arenibacter palladensis]|uniref:SMP-30/gluconolactonase/LRE family protein n=1 Tax=Arenibacter palladensis TaxID=237373 RepID=UPI0026E1385E|nr:SMP-30/gluconolactonase/LRE family protein [Arenibacter palladensis]MDO6604633.1 SMP-30/gluconolactonase/LRE family protein [Arenibacter palladensis]